MSPLRKTAFAAGALYLLSFVSIPTLVLYNPLRASNYILGHGSNTGIIVGAILEVIVALAGMGTAVALFPVVKRQNEGVALGFVGSRTLEGAGILAGVLFGLIGQRAPAAVLLAIPIAVWEFSLGVYLVVKGFKPSAITALYSRNAGVDNGSLVPVAATR